jgi:hypothetical protein
MEELENLEETLNDSIKESLGARTGKPSHGKKKGAVEEEEDYFRYAWKNLMLEYQLKITSCLICLRLLYLFVFISSNSVFLWVNV